MENLQVRSLVFKCGVLFPLICLLGSFSSVVQASVDSCLDCHSSPKFMTTNKKLYTYFLNWKNSVHAHEGLTCIDCHNGDPSKADKKSAHGQGQGEAVTLSAVYYSNIPDTCGRCHKDIVAGYKESRHYEYLTKDDLLEMRGGNCVTCHDMGMSISEGNNLVDTATSACEICHNYKTRNFPDVPGQVHIVLENYTAAKRLYSNLIIQHHDQLTEPICEKYANDMVSIISSLHALRLDTAEKDCKQLLITLKDVRKKLRKKFDFDFSRY